MTAFLQRLARPALRLAVASLPLVVLILSAAPSGCSGQCSGDDLSAPPPAIVLSLP